MEPKEWTNIEVAQWLTKSKPELVAALAAERENRNINLEVAESAGKVAEENLQLRSQLAAEREKREQAERELDRLIGEIPEFHDNKQLREQLAALVDALKEIKIKVCGDKLPNWTNDAHTTQTRWWIADVCDIALAKVGK